jgi:hypothetical protein
MLAEVERSLDTTFTAIIRNKAWSVNIKDVRATSLMGYIYKIIFKVLANNLKNKNKKTLEKFISKSHNTFIKGRLI